jgi:hypothetical protein
MANLTTKELTALEDTLGAEQVLVKKYHTLSEQCTEPAIKSRLQMIANRHQEHYNTLVNYLR